MRFDNQPYNLYFYRKVSIASLLYLSLFTLQNKIIKCGYIQILKFT